MDLLSPVNPLPALAAMLLAFGTAALLQRRFGVPAEPGRFATVDGLRGYLALGVFIHHGCIWYFFLRSGAWKVPSSHLYAHLGQSSVAMFFMITGFLFFSKLLAGRERPIDWFRLFVSRAMRLAPLYLCAMLILFTTIAVLSKGELNEPPIKLVKEAIRWLSFTILSAPPINQIEATGRVIAGVTWSLPYEWFFYGALPLLALVVGVVPRWPYLLLSIASTAWLILWQPAAIHLWAFGAGMFAVFACRSARLCRWASGHGASSLAIALLIVTVVVFPSSRAYAPLALLSLTFTLVTCGNTLFGLLAHPASRLLGEMAYSIYLLHGPLLFMLFHFLLGVDYPDQSMSASVHWAWVLGLTPLVVGVSFASFRFIEAPAMRATPAVTQALRRLFQKRQDRLAA